MKITKNTICILFIYIITIFIIGYGLLLLSKSRTFQLFGNIINHIDTDKKIVALTFDDAPSEYTDDVLKILSEKNIKATFYVTGLSMLQYPDQTKNIVSQNHELGNHSYSHTRMIFKTPSFIKNEIESTNLLIRNSGYQGKITFRPPNGKKMLFLPWYLYQNDIDTITWNVEPDTYFTGDSENIIKHTMENTIPGSIILMHPFCEKECHADRDALPIIIDELIAKNYQFVTISELLAN